MKTCKGCRWAEWKRTASGSLHPSGEGMCGFKVNIPVLPASIRGAYGVKDGLRRIEEAHRGVSRKREYQEHCPCWAPETTA